MMLAGAKDKIILSLSSATSSGGATPNLSLMVSYTQIYSCIKVCVTSKIYSTWSCSGVGAKQSCTPLCLAEDDFYPLCSVTEGG